MPNIENRTRSKQPLRGQVLPPGASVDLAAFYDSEEQAVADQELRSLVSAGLVAVTGLRPSLSFLTPPDPPVLPTPVAKVEPTPAPPPPQGSEPPAADGGGDGVKISEEVTIEKSTPTEGGEPPSEGETAPAGGQTEGGESPSEGETAPAGGQTEGGEPPPPPLENLDWRTWEAVEPLYKLAQAIDLKGRSKIREDAVALKAELAKLESIPEVKIRAALGG